MKFQSARVGLLIISSLSSGLPRDLILPYSSPYIPLLSVTQPSATMQFHHQVDSMNTFILRYTSGKLFGSSTVRHARCMLFPFAFTFVQLLDYVCGFRAMTNIFGSDMISEWYPACCALHCPLCNNHLLFVSLCCWSTFRSIQHGRAECGMG